VPPIPPAWAMEGAGDGGPLREIVGDGGVSRGPPRVQWTPQRAPQRSAPSTPTPSCSDGAARGGQQAAEALPSPPSTPLSAARAMRAAAAEIAVLENELLKIKQQKVEWATNRKRSRGTAQEGEVAERYAKWKNTVTPCLKHSAGRIATLRKHQQAVRARMALVMSHPGS